MYRLLRFVTDYIICVQVHSLMFMIVSATTNAVVQIRFDAILQAIIKKGEAALCRNASAPQLYQGSIYLPIDCWWLVDGILTNIVGVIVIIVA